MIVKLLIRRDTTENWENINPVLDDGEFGIERCIDNSTKVKIGNGVNDWNTLKYDLLNDIEINNLLENEVNKLNDNLNEEIQNRLEQVNNLNENIDIINNILKGTNVILLEGASLTRAINGITEIPKILFDNEIILENNKTIIYDIYGTIGLYTGDIDTATINCITMSLSPISHTETPLIGQVATHAELPLTVNEIETLFGRTPVLDNYIQVLNDETFNGLRTEWYIISIDLAGNIQWGNPVIINDSDYQAQTTTADSGKVLIGGLTPGTFGISIPVDTELTNDSNNLVNAKAIYSYLQTEITKVNNYILTEIDKAKRSLTMGRVVFTNAGTYNFAAPVDGYYNFVIAGGGGSGASNTNNGNAGGNTTLTGAVSLTANGGGGGNSNNTGGAGGVSGSGTSNTALRGLGGILQIDGCITSGGNGGTASSGNGGGGGGSGYVASTRVFLNKNQTVQITIGAGGAATSGTNNYPAGTSGSPGFCIINWHGV